MICTWCHKEFDTEPVTWTLEVYWLGVGARLWCSTDCRDAQDEHEQGSEGGS